MVFRYMPMLCTYVYRSLRFGDEDWAEQGPVRSLASGQVLKVSSFCLLPGA